MNTLILNRESFELPSDGWYQIAPIGEFPHAGAGVIQVVDAAACEAMVNAYRTEAEKPNFAGLLIDFDHFSLDGKQKSEAAGWITALEARVGETEDGRLKTEDLQDLATEGTQPSRKATAGEAENTNGDQRPTPNAQHPTSNNGGLWGKIRWSDAGEACVRGGRYRFLSPVWAKADCEDLGGGRLRPVRLMNAAVTNDPNIKGMVPLSNRVESRKSKWGGIGTYNAADGVESAFAEATADMPVPPGDTDRVEPVPPGAGGKVAPPPAPMFKLLGANQWSESAQGGGTANKPAAD